MGKIFSEAVARGIAGRKGKDSYVIGLFGSWGSGKSSVKNMIVETLECDKSTCPTVVEFNPWQFKDADQLTQAFFNEIASAFEKSMGSEDEVRANKIRAAKWKQWGGALNNQWCYFQVRLQAELGDAKLHKALCIG